jgi:hypothetical protein
MQSKLTLSIEQEVIDRAKAYAKEQGISLSKLVQNFLKKEAKSFRPKNDTEPSKKLNHLVGVLTLPEDYDLKNEKAKQLWEKYHRLG